MNEYIKLTVIYTYDYMEIYEIEDAKWFENGIRNIDFGNVDTFRFTDRYGTEVMLNWDNIASVRWCIVEG